MIILNKKEEWAKNPFLKMSDRQLRERVVSNKQKNSCES